MNSNVVHCVANGIAIKFSLPDYIRLLSKSNLLSFLFHKRDIYFLIKLFFKNVFICAKKKKYIYFYMSFPTKCKWHLSIGIDPNLDFQVEFGALH